MSHERYQIMDSVRRTLETSRAAAEKGGRTELHALARLWLSEGIPFAFRAIPGLYEIVREWIATRLSIHPKELTLIGSGRQGSSIAPPPKTGKPFDDESDLDWSVVSQPLFVRFKEEFETWAKDYRNGIVQPRQRIERQYWDENLSTCPRTLQRGFIDPHKVPTWDRYPLSQLTGNTMWLVGGKCRSTVQAPVFKKSTIRVYEDWNAFIKQLAINLDYSCKALAREGLSDQQRTRESWGRYQK